MSNKTIMSLRYRGHDISIIKTDKYTREVREEATRLWRIKPQISEIIRKEVEMVQSYTTIARRVLRDTITEKHSVYTLQIIRKEPKHFKFLNRLAEIFYLDKIQGPLGEALSEGERRDTKYLNDRIVNYIRGKNTRIQKLRKLSRQIHTTEDVTRCVPGHSESVVIPRGWVVRARVKHLTGTREHRVFTEPNSILKLAEARKSKQVFKPKKPMTDERHVSVEIEFAIKLSMQELGIELNDAGVSEYVHLKTDGSVRDFPDGYNAFEISVCMPVSKRDNVLEKTLEVLNKNGAKVNRTCGLHVHLDMRGQDHLKAFSNLVSAQPILYRMVPASRRSNTYCAKTLNKNFSHYYGTSNRYLGINPQAYRKYGTLEVRLHSGTTDYTKITNFVDILSAVAYNDKGIARGASTVSGFAKQHKLSKYLELYINQRISLFNNSSQEEAA